MVGIRTKPVVNMADIEFKHVTFNVLKDYIVSRRIYFDVRCNVWEDYITTIGVFYKGFLCGGCLVKKIHTEKAMIKIWYSREDRAKMELLRHVERLLALLGYKYVEIRQQKKWLVELLENDWEIDGIYLNKELKNDRIRQDRDNTEQIRVSNPEAYDNSEEIRDLCT
jgi:hypothetical protein